MVRHKNALRGHLVAPYTGEDTPPEESAFLLLAKYIQTADPDTNEETEDNGFYDGDGTPETDVTSVAIGYSFSGHLDRDDEAQTLIAGMEFETGDGRKCWFKRVSADGETSHVGKATVSGIVVGGGDATDYEAFECNIRWDKKPDVVPAVPAG